MEPPEKLRAIGYWDLEYISELPSIELDWFECKASAWLTSDNERLIELSTYLSAFANYDGGYLLIGAKNPTDGQPFQLDEGVDFSYKNGVSGWLEDKLPNLVEPRLPRIQVQAIPLAVGATRGPVVVYVPPSTEAPHQALDKRFYSRTGTKRNQLGTTAILDIAHRQKNPVLSVRIFFNLWEVDLRKPPQSNLRWEITNTSNVICQHFGLELKVPMMYEGKPIVFEKPAYLEDDHGKCFWHIFAHNRLGQPLFPKATAGRNAPAKYGGEFQPGPGQPARTETLDAVEIRLFADEAPFQDFSFPLHEVLRLHSPG